MDSGEGKENQGMSSRGCRVKYSYPLFLPQVQDLMDGFGNAIHEGGVQAG